MGTTQARERQSKAIYLYDSMYLYVYICFCLSSASVAYTINWMLEDEFPRVFCAFFSVTQCNFVSWCPWLKRFGFLSRLRNEHLVTPDDTDTEATRASWHRLVGRDFRAVESATGGNMLCATIVSTWRYLLLSPCAVSTLSDWIVC